MDKLPEFPKFEERNAVDDLTWKDKLIIGIGTSFVAGIIFCGLVVLCFAPTETGL